MQAGCSLLVTLGSRMGWHCECQPIFFGCHPVLTVPSSRCQNYLAPDGAKPQRDQPIKPSLRVGKLRQGTEGLCNGAGAFVFLGVDILSQAVAEYVPPGTPQAAGCCDVSC